MSLTVMTGWSPSGYLQYGREFTRTFNRYWPDTVKLVVYGEAATALPANGEFRALPPECMAFIERHQNNPAACGRAEREGWKARDIVKGYSYRFDAVKFCRQGFIPLHAFMQLDTEFLLWLDGDVITHAPVDPKVICSLLPRGKDVAYLGREPKHPDIAFQLYRNTAATFQLLHAFEFAYRSDAVFNMKEWHSAFVWRQALLANQARAENLTPRGSGHVWFQSPLRAWMDHLKGTSRKENGRSLERR